MDPAELRFESSAQALTVFYHGKCLDGITGAWCIYRALPEKYQERLHALGGLFAEGGPGPPLDKQLAVGPAFIGIAPDNECLPPVPSVRGRHVIYVDVTPAEASVRWVHGLAKSVNFLDHHRSQKPVLDVARSLPRTQVDYSEVYSAAQLAWNWAHEILVLSGPHAQQPRKAPLIVNYVGDRDLWNYTHYRSREVCKAILVENTPLGFRMLTILAGWKLGDPRWDTVADRGHAYLIYEEQVVSKMAAHAYPASVLVDLPSEDAPREYCALVVNAPTLQSEVGDFLMAKAEPDVHFVMAWYFVMEKDETWVSIRTNRPDVDLSVISKCIVGAKPGGGGHPRAAGCAIVGNRILEVAVPHQYAQSASRAPAAAAASQ